MDGIKSLCSVGPSILIASFIGLQFDAVIAFNKVLFNSSAYL